jgi:two-component system cell cycle sensor histidine kinase/response regulator CckA
MTDAHGPRPRAAATVPAWPAPSAPEAAPVIVALLDGEGVIRSVSSSITPVAGHRVEELVGRPATELVHPEDLAIWASAFSVAAGVRPGQARECRLRGVDGRWIPVEVEGVGRVQDPMLSAIVVTLRDRTASAQAAERLRRLTLAIEQSPAAVLITDLEGRIEYVNQRFTEMTGYTPEAVLGQTPRVLQSGLTARATYEQLWATIRAGNVWRGELCNRRKDGRLYWHSTSISPVRDGAGRVSGFVAVQEDITERRRIVEESATREREYRRIVETATEGIWGVDAEHRTTFVNERLASMLGYTVAEMIGRPVFDFTDEEGRVIAEASRARRRLGIREQLDFKLRRRDGSTFWVLMSTGPAFDDEGQYVGALAMVTDVTRRRQAEEALRRSEVWFRSLIEGAQDLIAVVLPDGTFRYASPSFERILGHRPSDLVGRLAFDFVHPDDRESVVRVFREGVHEPEAVRALQYRCQHKDGTWRLIDGIGRNLSDDPVVGGVVINGRDATERVLLEAQFRQAQKMEALGRLVGGVAHDFNNILAVILASSDIMRADLPEEHPCQTDVLEVQKAAERAAALTRQLLAFTRQQVLMPRVLDLNALVHDMEGMLGRLLGEDVSLSFRLASEPTSARADPGQLEQVLLNLVVNGRDAMPDGGRLMVETAVVELDDAYAGRHDPMPPGRYAMLAVTDTGIGMSQEIQARVFEPFFTTKEPGKGTGLGLATVYGIVKQSEGFIWLYSEPGLGTTFKIYFPHVDQAVDSAGPATSAPELPRGEETVLITEDNTAVRQSARRGLERCGYTVLEANGPDAFDLVRQYQGAIHLLLTDVVMPEVSGPQLSQKLKELRPGLRVLFMSGYTDAILRSKLAEVGGAYLQKPFTLADLARKVRETLDAKESARA